MSVDVLTFGCRLNIHESEVIRRDAAALSDTTVVNTCAVTGEAVRQARQAIRKLRREKPDTRIVVTGCAAQADPHSFAAMPEVSRVLGNREKFDFRSFLANAERVRVSDIMAVKQTAPHLLSGFAERSRAFVEVQNGCDHRCTFCIIPYGRGNSRSVPAGLVVERIKKLAGEGFREVVLTGVDVTSYGPDLPGAPTLGQLVERILKHVPELPRLRLSSLDCIEMDERLFELACHEPRFMPHLHMSFQAGDDMVLKRMKRRHKRRDAIETVTRLKERRPEIAIGADLIAGFPTETEAMFANSQRLVEECGLTFLHVFPYSPRPGTPAARMPQLDRRDIKERAERLRHIGRAALDAYLSSCHGRRIEVLMEKDNVGRTPQFAELRLDTSAASGRLISASVTGHDAGRLTGTAQS